ncbi:MAG TPA: ABC transporter substrate-binding protein, partial [Mycobacteriales bacterium]|nr:ABC transporter substrate-binding protein [Mycobacteriales bacterium]
TDASTIAGLESGRIGVAEVAPGSQVDSAVAVAAQHNTAISSSTTETSVLWQLLFNLNDSLAGQLGLRQALTFATDRPEIVADSVAFGDPATLAARSRIFADGQQGSFAEAPPVVTYDPTRAASLFATSGYVAGPDGLLRFGGVGRPLSLTIVGPSGNPTILAAELQLQAEWAAAGVTLAITNEPMAELLGTTLPQGRYQIAIAPYLIQAFPTASATVYTDPVLGAPQGGTGPTDSLASRPKWPWSVSTPPGTEPGAAAAGLVTRDVVGEQSAQIGSRYEEVLAELNTDQAAAILAKLDTFLWHELATVPLFQQPVAIVQQADLVNVSDSPTWDGVFWDAENWAIQLNPRGG